MSRFIFALLVLCLALPLQAKTPNWKDIVDNPAKYKQTPTKSEYYKKIAPASSGYELFKIADRFGILVDPEGYPLVIFDYTMEPLSKTDWALGAIGIGGWSLRDIFKKYKQIKETPMDVLNNDETLKIGMMPEPGSNDQSDYGAFYDDLADVEGKMLPGLSGGSAIENGRKEFAKLKFRDEWVRRSGQVAAMGVESNTGFSPASFTLGDMYLTAEQAEKLYEPMSKFSKLVLKENLEKKDLARFMSQFKMDWNENTQEFSMVWSPAIVETKGVPQPKFPGWVVNYQTPLDLLAYKYSLSDMERQLSYSEYVLGKWGGIVGTLLSRVLNNVKNQMNFHEQGLQVLLEAYLRGEYKISIPADDPQGFFDATLTLLYLNKMVEDDSIDVTDGAQKRRFVEEKEAKYKTENLAWLAKKKFEVQAWSDGRNATVFKNGKRKGIVNLAMKRAFITHQPSFLHYDLVPWYKTASRMLMEVFVGCVRYVMPDSFQISEWLASWINIGISIYIPTMFWDVLFKGRSYTEIAYEGGTFMKFNEAVAGRWKKVPGYVDEDLPGLKNLFATQRVNPFEVPMKYEATAISINYKRVRDIIGFGFKDFNHALP